MRRASTILVALLALLPLTLGLLAILSTPRHPKSTIPSTTEVTKKVRYLQIQSVGLLWLKTAATLGGEALIEQIDIAPTKSAGEGGLFVTEFRQRLVAALTAQGSTVESVAAAIVPVP